MRSGAPHSRRDSAPGRSRGGGSGFSRPRWRCTRWLWRGTSGNRPCTPCTRRASGGAPARRGRCPPRGRPSRRRRRRCRRRWRGSAVLRSHLGRGVGIREGGKPREKPPRRGRLPPGAHRVTDGRKPLLRLGDDLFQLRSRGRIGHGRIVSGHSLVECPSHPDAPLCQKTNSLHRRPEGHASARQEQVDPALPRGGEGLEKTMDHQRRPEGVHRIGDAHGLALADGGLAQASRHVYQFRSAAQSLGDALRSVERVSRSGIDVEPVHVHALSP